MRKRRFFLEPSEAPFDRPESFPLSRSRLRSLSRYELLSSSSLSRRLREAGCCWCWDLAAGRSLSRGGFSSLWRDEVPIAEPPEPRCRFASLPEASLSPLFPEAEEEEGTALSVVEFRGRLRGVTVGFFVDADTFGGGGERERDIDSLNDARRRREAAVGAGGDGDGDIDS